MKMVLFLLLGVLMFSCSNDEMIDTNNHSNKMDMEEGIKLYAQKQLDNPQTKGVSLNDNVWKTGQTIQIKFLNICK